MELFFGDNKYFLKIFIVPKKSGNEKRDPIPFLDYYREKQLGHAQKLDHTILVKNFIFVKWKN